MTTSQKLLFAASLLVQRVKYNIWPVGRIHLIGDSLMAAQPWYKYPRTGWGSELFAYLNTDKVKVVNHARNGGSTMSFEEQGYFDKALRSIQKGDIVIIGFAHNDRHFAPATGGSSLELFRNLITKFVAQIKEKQATVVLSTPINLYQFGDEHGGFPEEIKKLAGTLSINMIDLNAYSKKVLLNLGQDKAKEIYLITESRRFIMHPNGIEDFIHLSPYGAQVFAKYVSEFINSLLLNMYNL